jgi:uroporphyrinogen decarboxylase
LKDLGGEIEIDPISRVLGGKAVSPIPIWMMRQAGRYLPEYREVRSKAGGFVELCLNPDLAAEVTLQPIRRFQFDAAIIFSDILIVPHALGVKLWFEEGEGPRLDPVASRQSLKRVQAELDRNIVERVYEAIGQVRGALPRNVALIGFCGAPWTVASYLVAGRGTDDQGPARQLAKSDPVLFGEIIDQLAAATAEHLIGQLNAGANLVQIFDTWAGVLDSTSFRKWCLDPTVEIVKRVRTAIPHARIILFPKGVATDALANLAKATGADAVSVDQYADRKVARQLLSNHCAIQGNLDPDILIEGGASLDRAIDAIKEDFHGIRHIFNLGHGIKPTTPIKHVEQMIARVRGS